MMCGRNAQPAISDVEWQADDECVLGAGDWYCSAECGGIAARMRERAGGVAVPLEGEYSWQILRGKDGTHATTWALKAAQVRARPHVLSISIRPPFSCKLICSVLTAK